MTVKKSTDVPTNLGNFGDMTEKESPDVTDLPDRTEEESFLFSGKTEKEIADLLNVPDGSEKEIMTSKSKARKVPKLKDITVDDLKVLISEVVATELEKWFSQSTRQNSLESKDLDNSVSKKLYINTEGKYVLPERTPEEIAQQAQAIRDMFAEWDRDYDTEEQRETFAYLQKALSDDFPSEGLLSENPLLSVSQ